MPSDSGPSRKANFITLCIPLLLLIFFKLFAWKITTLLGKESSSPILTRPVMENWLNSSMAAPVSYCPALLDNVSSSSVEKAFSSSHADSAEISVQSTQWHFLNSSHIKLVTPPRILHSVFVSVDPVYEACHLSGVQILTAHARLLIYSPAPLV